MSVWSPPAASAVLAALPGGLLAALLGGLLGVATQRWLGWLARGARVAPSWCVVTIGALWGAVVTGWSAGVVPGRAVPLLLGLGWLAVSGSVVDVAVRRLPDALTLPALPLVLVLLAPLGGGAVVRGAVGGLLLWVAHAAVRWGARSAMGGGDVKLSAALGAATAGVAWTAVVAGTLLAALLTAVVGVAIRQASPAPRVGTGLPHGPSMLVACLVVVGAAAAWPGATGVG